MFDNITKYLRFDNLEAKVDKVLTLEKSIKDIKSTAQDLYKYYSPEIAKLEGWETAVENFCVKSAGNDQGLVEGLTVKSRTVDKLNLARSEYFSQVGALRKSIQPLERKLGRLMAKDNVNSAVHQYKKREALEVAFDTVYDSFISDKLEGGLFAKALIHYQIELGEEVGKPTSEAFTLIEKSFNQGLLSEDIFEKAKRTAQEKKVSTVMGEFKAGTLRSGSGDKVTDKDQAIAIAMSEAEMNKGEEDPKKEEPGYTPEYYRKMITEHERLIGILEPHAKMDKKIADEIKAQKKELKEYKEQLVKFDKSLTGDHVVLGEYGEDHIMDPDYIEKAEGHKYLRREGSPGNYKYIYEEADEKGKKQEIETPVGEEVSPATKGLSITQYSKKAFSIGGDTYANLELMREIKKSVGVGTFIGKIKAWMFPNSVKEEVLGMVYSDVKAKGEDDKAQAIQNQKNELDPGTEVNIKGIDGEIKKGASDSDGTKYDIKTKDGTELKGVDEKVIEVPPSKNDKEIREEQNEASPASRVKAEKAIYGVKPVKDIHNYSLQEYLGMHGLSKDDIDKVVKSITAKKEKGEQKKKTPSSGGTKKQYTKPGQVENLTKRQLIGKLVFAHYQAVKKAIESGEPVDPKAVALYSDLKELQQKKKRGPLSEEHKRKIAEALKKDKSPEESNPQIKKENEEAKDQGFKEPADKKNYTPKDGEDIVIDSPSNQSKGQVTLKTKDYTDIPALDVIIPKPKNILTAEKPYFIPDIDQSRFERNSYTLSATKIGEDKYLVALDGFMGGGISPYSFSVAGIGKYNKHAIMSLDTYTATQNYYQIIAKEKLKQKNLESEQATKKFIKENLAKKGVSEAEAQKTADEYKGKKKRLSVLPKNKMTYDQMHMIQAMNIGIEGEGKIPGRTKTWEIYNQFVKDRTQKSIDLELNQEYIDSAYTKGAETSYGDSNTKNDLLDDYGVKVKRQNGDEINKSEIAQIQKALDITSSLFGKNKKMNEEFGLKISHSGDVLMHARKAVGLFHPAYNAIGVSAQYGDSQFQFTFGHEYAHFMDYSIGKGSGNSYASDKQGSTANRIADTFRKNMNETQKSAYQNRTCECFARALEQYVATETYGKDAEKFGAGDNYEAKGNHVNSKVYEEQIKPLIEQFVRENKEILKSLGVFDTFDNLIEKGSILGEYGDKAVEKIKGLLKNKKGPTEAQKHAGNYKKEKVYTRGLMVSVENGKGSTRSGKDKNGKDWSVVMNNDYGYFNRTTGKDGDHIDVFLSDKPEDGKIFVIDQSDEDDKFDEHKVMVGFDSSEEALQAYKANFTQGFEVKYSSITEVNEADLKKWLGVDKGGKEKKRKPFGELKRNNIEKAEKNEPKNEPKKEEPKKDNRPLKEQAKEISGEILEAASKNAKDPDTRIAAHDELDRREKEEQNNGEENKTPKEEKAEQNLEEKVQVLEKQVKELLTRANKK